MLISTDYVMKWRFAYNEAGTFDYERNYFSLIVIILNEILCTLLANFAIDKNY